MFVPDLLHEFELGVWKAVFTHLMRVLYAVGGDKIQELNRRYVDESTMLCWLTKTSGFGKYLPLGVTQSGGSATMPLE